MKIVCLAAQMRSGKDVVADYLVETFGKRFGEQWGKRGWAEGLKQVISDCFGISREEIEKWKVDAAFPPGYIVTMRQALQMVGDGFRQIKPDVWIQWTLSRSKEQPTVIPDGRYVNELRAIREAGGVNVLIVRPGYINDSPHPSEAQLRPIVEFYANVFSGTTEGPVSLDSIRSWCGETASNPAPEGAQYIDFVIRNDGTILDLQRKIDENLVPFLVRRFGGYVKSGDFQFQPEDITGTIPIEHFFPSGAYASVQGGLIDPMQPIWGRMGEWVLYHQQPGGIAITPPGAAVNFGETEVLMRLFDLTVAEAEAVLQRIQEVRSKDWKETSTCEEMNSRLNMAFNLKGAQLMSDYDILTKYMKYSPEEANEILARLRKQKLEELKLQIVSQNPQLMSNDKQVAEPPKPTIEPRKDETFLGMLKRKFGMDEGDLFAMYCVMEKWVEQDHKKFHREGK